MRGLKLRVRGGTRRHPGRTLTSAWIETIRGQEPRVIPFVALSRVRGLKPAYREKSGGDLAVALSRVRGLKLC